MANARSQEKVKAEKKKVVPLEADSPAEHPSPSPRSPKIVPLEGDSPVEQQSSSSPRGSTTKIQSKGESYEQHPSPRRTPPSVTTASLSSSDKNVSIQHNEDDDSKADSSDHDSDDDSAAAANAPVVAMKPPPKSKEMYSKMNIARFVNFGVMAATLTVGLSRFSRRKKKQ
mmetsp:Transcript_279/g.694  ORF Transcript_279/g.694 Transcript_279/m.694 type:complete len:171 (+) Transcript_279:460-972(+)|eukprot:CAMPEP_0116853802 /NCGR_PEP_ID=MMETSP0418-20121206/18162_1 /TAXON_ID=1158023 /ORGANISM="Astrosyne radiata, Strain 13vi08-1A" /LENGTH=170 /DNA_ID=CAMNT_0004486339 /DNA_START=394 /DNA_END=906 /DNA_ORIENTATION=+